MNRHAAVSLARQDHHGRFDRAVLDAQFDHVAGFQSEPPRHRGANERSIVPGEFGQRLGQFLQPTVVGPASVPDARIGPDQQIIRLRHGDRCDGSHRRARRGLGRDGCACLRHAVVDRLLPERREIIPPPRLPRRADDLVATRLEILREHCQHLVHGPARVERVDHRLDDRRRPVTGRECRSTLRGNASPAGASGSVARFRPGRAQDGR